MWQYLNVGFASVAATETLSGIARHEAINERLGRRREMPRKLDLFVEDLVEELVVVVGIKRRVANHHLKHENTQGPEVDRRAVRQLLHNFRRKVTGRTAKSRRARNAKHVFFTHAKIGNLKAQPSLIFFKKKKT